ncbi:hypothetical protein GCM10010145_47850 [Streptomyces ruber]|uniref:Uncharacterized protein n=2 Tax=Streptomyces TaxID=1883 RepID=A0A918EV36_9ACTN|nr:hypothetical protein GCM10010145_47850 [Streptomyces ruber]
MSAISQFFGRTPLGPAGWATALGTAAAATAGSLLLPPLASRIRGHLLPEDDGTRSATAGSAPDTDGRQGGAQDRAPGAAPAPAGTSPVASAPGLLAR